MKKFFGILIIATGISLPAYAQSFDADNGTGNLITAITAPASDVTGSVTRKSGTEAYAMSARRKVSAEGSYNAEPANHDNGSTGGGSAGYNEMLRNW
jgi:nitrous oxidase accessory protein NosD